MGLKIVAGVDCHKDSHHIAFIDSVGMLVHQMQIGTTAEDYAAAVKAARELGEVTWGLESTGCYGSAFARFLTNEAFTVYEVPGSYTKRHRKHASRHGKSDPLDAMAIAEAVLREAQRLPLYRSSDEREAIRLRYDQRDRLVQQRTQSINRLRHAALRLEIELPSDLTTRHALEGVVAAAAPLKGRGYSNDAAVDEILYAVEDIQRASSRIAEIEALLNPMMRRIAPELLEIHGVSTVTAAGLVGHSGDLTNCRSAAAFAMRSGTAPVPFASGKHWSVRVNAGGNRQLNRLIHVIATSQIRSKDHAGRRYYERKCQEGKSTKSARRCLKRRLATVIFYRLRYAQQRLSAPAQMAAYHAS